MVKFSRSVDWEDDIVWWPFKKQNNQGIPLPYDDWEELSSYGMGGWNKALEL